MKLNGGIAWHKDDFHILMTTSSSHNTVSIVVGNYASRYILNPFNHYEYLNLNSCQFNFFNENYDIQVK